MTAQQFQLKALIIGVDKLSPELEKIRKNLSAFRRNLKSFGQGGVEMAAGIGAFVGITSKAFADLEDASVRLKGSMMGFDGSVAPEFAQINELAKELGNVLPGNTADFQNMMTALTQQGVAPRDILDGIGKSAAYLGVQLKLAPEQAAEFAAKMSTATGTAAKDVMGLMDVIQRTANLGVRSEDMLQGFSKLSPALDIMHVKGLAAGQALAPLLAMAIRTGMAGESAGNAYRKMFQSFFDPKKLRGANELLAAKGKSLNFTDGKGEFGGVEKMFTQLQKLRDLTTAQRVPILKQLFGDDAETLQIVQLMIENGMAGYEAMGAKMKAQADLNMRVTAQLGTLKSLFEAAMGNAENLLAALGETFAPEIKQLTEKLGRFSGWVQNFVKLNPEFVRGILGMAAGLAGVKLAALGAAFAARALFLVVGKSPLGTIFRVLAMAAGLVMSNWDMVGPSIMAAWETIRPIVKAIGAIIGFFADVFMASLQPAIFVLKTLWSILKGIYGGIKDIVTVAILAIDAISKIKLPSLDFGAGSVTGFIKHMFASNSDAAQQKTPSLPAMAAQGQRVNGDINVNFANAPRGMRVAGAQTNQSGLRLNPDVGYSSFAMGMP